MPPHSYGSGLAFSGTPAAVPQHYSYLSLPEVLQLAASFRWAQLAQASVFSKALGVPPINGTLVVAELRSHVHDVATTNHDRRQRSLLCFPRWIYASNEHMRNSRLSILPIRASPDQCRHGLPEAGISGCISGAHGSGSPPS